jgi:hypothetical protein
VNTGVALVGRREHAHWMQHAVVGPIGRTSRAGAWCAALGLPLAAWLGVAGCAPSEEDIEREFDAYVEGANACSSASECSIAATECPLACFVAVRTDRVASVERKARELVQDYESGGESCDYSCLPPGAVECVRGRCAMAAL